MTRRWRLGLLLSLAVAGLLAPWACPWPDGLAWVRDRFGSQTARARPALSAPLPDYQLPGAPNTRLSRAAAALVGTFLVFAAACGLGYLLTRRRERE